MSMDSLLLIPGEAVECRLMEAGVESSSDRTTPTTPTGKGGP